MQTQFNLELFKHRAINGIRSSIATSQMALSKCPSTESSLKAMYEAQEWLDTLTDALEDKA